MLYQSSYFSFFNYYCLFVKIKAVGFQKATMFCLLGAGINSSRDNAVNVDHVRSWPTYCHFRKQRFKYKTTIFNWVNIGTEGEDVQAGVNSSLADISSSILIYSGEATIRNSNSLLHQELHKCIYNFILIRKRKSHNRKLRLFKGISEVLKKFNEKIN